VKQRGADYFKNSISGKEREVREDMRKKKRTQHTLIVETIEMSD